jgi:hypothetical protein
VDKRRVAQCADAADGHFIRATDRLGVGRQQRVSQQAFGVTLCRCCGNPCRSAGDSGDAGLNDLIRESMADVFISYANRESRHGSQTGSLGAAFGVAFGSILGNKQAKTMQQSSQTDGRP